MKAAADWYLVERRNGERFEVWLDEHRDPDPIGFNAIVIGSGLTRAAALRNAHAELLAQAARHTPRDRRRARVIVPTVLAAVGVGLLLAARRVRRWQDRRLTLARLHHVTRRLS